MLHQGSFKRRLCSSKSANLNILVIPSAPRMTFSEKLKPSEAMTHVKGSDPEITTYDHVWLWICGSPNFGAIFRAGQKQGKICQNNEVQYTGSYGRDQRGLRVRSLAILLRRIRAKTKFQDGFLKFSDPICTITAASCVI